ncbi:MAG: formylglycine-generating enzyme family protein [Cyanobacteria bacterium P01_H01_bin.15]
MGRIQSLVVILGLGLGFWLTNPLPHQALAASCPAGMTWIPGGTFAIGTDDPVYVEEEKTDDVTVSSFCMDTHEITNAEFAEFVDATGYVTVAERPLSSEEFPTLSESQLAPGSLVFTPPKEGMQQVAYLSWWKWTPGANWQHPFGPESNLTGKADHPVVHIAYEDAIAYADWKHQQLPTEAQWEFAAKAGNPTTEQSYAPENANTWQGMFPFFNTQTDGYLGTAPVMSFPPNAYGLYDMAGNVWELTADWYTVSHAHKLHAKNPAGPSESQSFDPKKPNEGATHVIKGGSYLCAKNYCSRYRPAARESQAPDTGTTHVGFRLVAPSLTS